MPAIRAICFDLDDTLWPCDAVIEHADQVLHQWLLQHYPRVPHAFSIVALREMRLNLMAEYPHLSHDFTALRKLNLAQAAAQVGYAESLVEPAFAVFIEARQQVNLYQDVIPVLEQLKSRYILCSITNGNADVKRIGLGHFFNVILTAREVGVAKPHPLIFATAYQQAQVHPTEMVHIGDDAECDIAGALGVGMRAVWINRQGKNWSNTYTPHAMITSLIELEPLLQMWEK